VQSTVFTRPIMARLSGLPSEHHHEGPGDAPRRKRGRPSKQQTPSEDMAPTGKRTASPSAELSQTKRTKRVQVDEDESQIAEEIQQSFSRSQRGDTIDVQTQSSTTTTRRHNRRHSEPPVAADDDDDELAGNPSASTQPLPGLTPHLDRVGASRSRFTNSRRARMSMPAQLQIERVDELDETDGTQVQFAPLTQVLDGRARRRLRRSHLSEEVNGFEDHQKQDKKMFLELRRQLKAQDDKIKDLEYRLEARRMGEIEITDDHADKLQEELEEARQQIDELRASSLYNGDEPDVADMSDADDDALLMVNPQELNMSQDLVMAPTPQGKYAARVSQLSSQMTLESLPTMSLSQLNRDSLAEGEDSILPDTIEDQAVERYERELQDLSKALGESQGALRLITIELQNLRFLEAGASTTDILPQLRHSFDSLRQELEKFFPGTTAGLTNQQLLRKVPELFSGIFFELKEKIAEQETSQNTAVVLRRQYEGVLDLLGDSDERVKQLDADVFTLDRANEDKQRTILELEERTASLTTLTIAQEAQLKENDAQIAGLVDENEDQEGALTRLRDALEKYRNDLDTVTATATAFETDHHETIARMEQEHAEAVASLEAERAAEQEGREAAEAEAQQKDEYIEQLEVNIANLEGEVELIVVDMAELKERLAIQTAAREAAEGERDAQTEQVYQHANTIENLNEIITDLREQLADYRDNLAAERTQREKTEADLDEANEKIEDLNTRLHDTGLQANELRSKLFQLQQDKETAIIDLQEAAEQRENDLNGQLTDEVALRETAENNMALLKQQILQLQGDLVIVEANLADMTEARNDLEQYRDIQVANLAAQVAELTTKYVALENSTNSTITSLQANIIDLNNQIQRQQAEINDLVEQVAEKERIYQQDTTILKGQIVDLEEDLTAQRAENEGYRKENDSLSKRVEAEANELLNIVGSHNDQVDSLKIVIKTQEATIKNLQENSAKRTTEYEELLEDRTNEITEMRLLGDARVETIVLLEAQIDDMKERFRQAEEDTRATINTLTISQRQLQEQNERLADDLKRRNQEALQAIQEMRVKRVEVKTSGADLHRVVHGKVAKTSEKVKIGKKGKKASKRQWDSGFGVDENVEDEEPLAA
jgi:chromosome segregation ATPase